MGDRVSRHGSDASSHRSLSFSTQENVTALLRELNLETYPQYHAGVSMAELQRRVHKYSLPVPYVSLLSFLESIYQVFRVRRTILANDVSISQF